MSLILLLVTLLCVQQSKAEYSRVLYGKVRDRSTRNVLPGAKIKIDDGKRGSFANTKGEFKLPIQKGDKYIEVTSIGYEKRNLLLKDLVDTVEVLLEVTPITTNIASVVGNIEVEEIIKRAISKKQENQKKITTFQAQLYSKLLIELDGSVMDVSSNNSGGINASLGVGEQEEEKAKRQVEKNSMFILETFSDNYKDYDKKIDKSFIQQRKQTANLKPQDNLLAISRFINFYDDEVKVINTKIKSPLASDALQFYNYTLVERTKLADRYVYKIRVQAKSDLYPTFEGYIYIIEQTYNLIQTHLSVADFTAIDLLNNVSYLQKFEEDGKDIWYPSFLETKARAKVDIIAGVIDIGADIVVTSIYNNVKINEVLPDSLYISELPNVVVAPTADSVSFDFWEKNSLIQSSEKEKQIYFKIDSLAKIDEAEQAQQTPVVNLSLTPIIGFNRVSSYSLGLNPTITIFDNTQIGSDIIYSFGQKKLFGEVAVSQSIYSTNGQGKGQKANDVDFNIYGKYFMDIKRSNFFSQVPNFINSISALLYHSDFYDYYKSEGFLLGANFGYEFIGLNLKFENSLDDVIYKSTDDGLDWFSSSGMFKWRKTLKQDENDLASYGRFKKVSLGVDLWNNTYSVTGDVVKFKFNAFSQFTQSADAKVYKAMQVAANLYTPILYTGYEPISIELFTKISIADKDSPTQYLFRLPTNVGINSYDFSFFTAPNGYFGGTEVYTYAARVNLSDHFWRLIGLPKYLGRGVGTNLTIVSGRTENKNESRNGGNYIATKGKYFTELGIGFYRIPLFITNIFYFGVDFHFGFGSVQQIPFGVSVKLTTPF